MPLAPPADCPLCPRLVAFRHENQQQYPDFYNGAVPCFGPLGSPLLIAGLAPGLKGANATGRPFTNDYAGDLLYKTLGEFGFAEGTYKRRRNDGLRLTRARIANAVRCVPPQNKPVGAEINTCRQFLESEIDAGLEQGGVKVILALGGVAHGSVLSAFKARKSAHKFAHEAVHNLRWPGRDGVSGGALVSLVDSYHCSRYNTNTGRLTPDMFRAVFARINRMLEETGYE